LFGLSGCSLLRAVPSAQAQVNSMADANKVASATCSKAHPGTAFAAATYLAVKPSP